MGFYIPSIFTLMIAFTVVAVIFMSRVSLIAIAVVALAILCLAMYQHAVLFSIEYKSMTMVDALIPLVPYIMVGAIIFFSTLYIMFIQGSSTTTIPSNSASSSGSWFGSLWGNKSSTTTNSPNYSANYTSASSRRNSGSRPSSNSLEREYLSALDRGI